MKIRLAEIFQDYMILQRGRKTVVWGECQEAGILSVRCDGRPLCEERLAPGSFRIELPPMDVAEDVTMEIGDRELKHVDIGEVWLAGGQSNMEFPLSREAEGERMISGSRDMHFRMYTVGRYTCDEEREECPEPLPEWDHWVPCMPETAGSFSAVAFYFGRKLREDGVPLGIINCNLGGTSASTWLDKACLKRKELSVYLKDYEEALAKLDLEEYYRMNRIFRKGRGTKATLEAAARFPVERKRALVMGPWFENRPGGLYESMLKRVIPFTLRGVIWYQGESNSGRAFLYASLFEAVIDCWRRDWGEEMPFLYVQLAPFSKQENNSGENYPELRRQQERVQHERKHVYMVSIGDVGEAYNLHPGRKKEVGFRLALMALNKVYGRNVMADAPECEDGARQDEGLLLLFRNAEGLYVEGGKLNALKLYAGGKEIGEYQWRVQGCLLVLSGFAVEDGIACRIEFAQTPYYEINLYNAARIPALPFTIEL